MDTARAVFEAGRMAKTALQEWHVNLPPKPCRLGGNKRKGAAAESHRGAPRAV